MPRIWCHGWVLSAVFSTDRPSSDTPLHALIQNEKVAELLQINVGFLTVGISPWSSPATEQPMMKLSWATWQSGVAAAAFNWQVHLPRKEGSPKRRCIQGVLRYAIMSKNTADQRSIHRDGAGRKFNLEMNRKDNIKTGRHFSLS